MEVFKMLRTFKKARDNFIDLPPTTRAWLLQKYANIPYLDAEALSVKEQGKIIFTLMYGKHRDELLRRLLQDYPGV